MDIVVTDSIKNQQNTLVNELDQRYENENNLSPMLSYVRNSKRKRSRREFNDWE